MPNIYIIITGSAWQYSVRLVNFFFCCSLFLSSFANQKEAKLVVLLLKQLGRSYHMRKEKLRIGIITPYSAQKRCIKLALEEELDKELKTCMQ